MKASSTPNCTDKGTGWSAVENKAQEQDLQASRAANSTRQGSASQLGTTHTGPGHAASRAPHSTGPGLAGQQVHKPQDQGRGGQQCTTQHRTSICWPAVEHSTGPGQVHASRAPHAKGPRHEGQQDNTSNRTSTRRPAGRHTTQDQVHGGQQGNTLHRTKHTNQQGTTQHRIGHQGRSTPHGTEPGYAGEQGNTQHRTKTRRFGGYHTVQDKDA